MDLHQLGLYSLGLSIAQVPMLLVAGFKQQWSVVFYENMNKSNFKTVSKLITYFVSIMTITHFVLILYAKEALIIVVNERYYDVIPVLGVIILGAYFSGLVVISDTMLNHKNKFDVISKIIIVAAIINIILNIILIPIVGIMGTAIASLTSFAIYFLVGTWHQRETLENLEAQGLYIAPIIALLLVTTLTYALSFFFEKSEISIIEITIKTGFLAMSVVMFIKAGIFSIKDVLYVYRRSMNLVFRRNKAYE